MERPTDRDRPAPDRDGLLAALAAIKARLARRVDPTAPEAGPSAEPVAALEAIRRAFDLSAFERDLLLLCAGIELDPTVASLCAAAQGDPSRTFPTFSLALDVLADPHWSALAPGGSLRHWRLIEVGVGPALTASPLRIDERVLHHLVGLPYLDERLRAAVDPIPPVSPDELAPSQVARVDEVAAAWAGPATEAGSPPLIHLRGPDPGDRRAVAAAAASSVGLRLGAIDAGSIPTDSAERELFVRLWEREAALGAAVLLVECDDAEPAALRAVARLTDRLASLVVVSDIDRRPIGRRIALDFEVRPPTAFEQLAAWRAALGPATNGEAAEIDAVASQFQLGLSAIRSSALRAAASPSAGPGALWEIGRSAARSRLDDLAQRIDSSAGWDDLVLPEPQAEAVRRILLHVRHRARVLDAWGFAGRSARGLGTGALFSGPSGTGKTLAAEVVAGELRLDLYRIDLSGVVSKYIGETEKNLRRVFDAAEAGGAVLLFDEADALFGKRSEVKDSHDRYANIEVSYLLQRMEAYRGLAILTTNLKGALDPAFLRRLRFVVQFPFPDPVQRAEIWRRVFPAATPTDRLDFARLARLNVAGGNIRNIALNAAFLAAEDGGPVRMAHLREAARIEFAKLERPLAESEVAGWD